MSQTNVVEQILDLARWAPSGDNAQPWRFELIDESQFVIHGHDTREHCLYDRDGRPSQISLGALIETAALAASRFGLAAQSTRRLNLPETRPTFDIRLLPTPGLPVDPLWHAIPERSVQRRPLSRRPLTASQRQILQSAVGPDYELLWFEGRHRWDWARLLWANAGLRLRLPEAFDTHRSVIEWGARFSKTCIPDQALGIDSITIAIMRRAMASWSRVEFMNRWLGGTLMPRVLMDWVPALACAAHIAILAKTPPKTTDDYVAGGRAVQRFWLCATQLGLQHQPAATPLVFSRYVREGRVFTTHAGERQLAANLAIMLDQMLDQRADRAVWLGRIGIGQRADSRSVRCPLKDLLIT